jgi:hypothetical protein
MYIKIKKNMSKVDEIIRHVKANSNVDDFTYNLSKAFEDMVSDIVEDVRDYKTTEPGAVTFCSFHQELMAKYLEERYLKD